MKRIFLLSFFISMGLLLQAQTADKKWAVGLGGGAYYGNTLEGTGIMTEFYLSRYLNSSFDLMLLNNLGLSNSEVENTLDISATFLNLRYKLNNGYILNENSGIQPYLYGGPGLIQDNEVSGFNFDAGAGFKFPLSSSIALFVEGGYINGLSEDKADEENVLPESFFKGVAGIEISFGKKKDSDGDGVTDRKDDCPDTPQGVVVDENGCPVDTDGDGLPDYKDDCPTEPGELALNGCPDRDGDGVADKDDDCPDTPGLKEFDGCPDTDGDGVIDKKDECPDTPKGYKVDEKGCPIDTDGDGLVDEEDDCPNEAGPIDNKGCPIVTFEFSSIHFEFDKYDLKSSAQKELDDIAEIMNEDETVEVELYGHADEIGSAQYNMDLSEKRADAARSYLVSKGVPAERIVKVVPLGQTQPVAPNDTEEGRAKNRRVEIKAVE
ncbi:OmpA family protein [uncultured Sunxiuqinia sp.]|uniref:OmpA family protein n=1 Tax=uncultured Sunxiuqinia sp. TaxID=1573825 RepID=UPI002AA75248|nr:OmpA family protein [uncultured Sunxiuqinia sp.]